MKQSETQNQAQRPGFTALRDKVRQAFAEFLTVPTLIIAGFFILAAVTMVLDHLDAAQGRVLRAFMQRHVFRNARATSDLLGTIASGIITVMSITFSMLLLAVQQSAASLTSQVFDQFLRRKLNQVFFGFFVGLALFALVILATVDQPYNPVYGASAAFLLTVVAFYLLILMLYSTIDQMRPVTIIQAIHDHTLTARQRQRPLLRVTRRSPGPSAAVRVLSRVESTGFVVGLDIDAMIKEVSRLPGEAEVVLRVTLGSFVTVHDVIAEIRTGMVVNTTQTEAEIRRAVKLARQRDLDHDPAFGLEQLHTIAWTSISTAKSNPAPGLLVIQSLRDLLARWTADEEADLNKHDPDAEPTASVVYRDDVFAQLFDCLESLAIVASESMQHQSMAEILRTLATLLDRLPEIYCRRVEDILLRSLSVLGDHALTADLDSALEEVARALADAGRAETAAAILKARRALGQSIGRLNSRATRVPEEP